MIEIQNIFFKNDRIKVINKQTHNQDWIGDFTLFPQLLKDKSNKNTS